MLPRRREIALACALSALAGYVDGIGFLHLGGLFVSFMSGNSTRLGVSLAELDWHASAEALGLIAAFVIGAALGTSIVINGDVKRRAWLLLAEAALLALAAALARFAGWQGLAVAILALAMGLENSVFQAGRAAGLGLTYVTGALVKVGQLLATALSGGARWDWLPNLGLWAALVAGSIIGALTYRAIGLDAIWFSALAALLLAGVSRWIDSEASAVI